MQFKDVIGQQDVKKSLIQTVKGNRISHAQLFIGVEGTGNLPMAIAYAQYISCTNKQEDDSCGECSSCRKYQKLIHPDLHFVYPVATTKKVLKSPVSDDFISDWRNFISESPYRTLNDWMNYIGVENKQVSIPKDESKEILKKLNLKSFEAEYKVMIIWFPEKMNITSSNKLLKIIEEPPSKTLFLLVAENPEEIIQTILSRTQIIKIPAIDKNSIAERLAADQSFGLDKNQAQNIGNLANGSFIRAKELIKSSEENTFNFGHFTKWMRLCYGKDVIGLIDWTEEISRLGRERQKSFLNYSLRMIRENLAMNLTKDTDQKVNYMTFDENAFSEKFSRFITQNNTPIINKEIAEAVFNIERNAYGKMVFLDLSFKVTGALHKHA